MEANVGFRAITLKDKDKNKIANFKIYTNMFAEHPTKILEIDEGKELVGFAVAVDDLGNPCWLDFVIAKGG